MKIVEPHAIVRDGRPQILVIGYFDPVYAVHIARLTGIARPGTLLIAAIAQPQAPLLPWRARAEIVAALASIDYVIPADAAATLAPDAIFDLREADESARAALAAHVVARHRSA
jgi:hypothetical protein